MSMAYISSLGPAQRQLAYRFAPPFFDVINYEGAICDDSGRANLDTLSKGRGCSWASEAT
jgi:hypothetical protein